jgi:hypothetical protein
MDNQMLNHSKRRLPCRADRTKIIEHARLVRAEARALAKQLDESLTLQTAKPIDKGAKAVTARFVATRAARVFVSDQS